MTFTIDPTAVVDWFSDWTRAVLTIYAVLAPIMGTVAARFIYADQCSIHATNPVGDAAGAFLLAALFAPLLAGGLLLFAVYAYVFEPIVRLVVLRGLVK